MTTETDGPIIGEANSVSEWKRGFTLWPRQCESGRKIPMFSRVHRQRIVRIVHRPGVRSTTKTATNRWLCPEEYTLRALKGTL